MAAKRPRLTVNDVLQYCADSDDDAEPDAMDDPPTDDPDAMDDPPTDPPAAASTTRSSEEQQKWSTTTKRLLIHPFTSTVGPTQDIFSSPLEVFEQFFSPDLMERIVTESNAYAKAAMGNDKFQGRFRSVGDEST